MSIEIFGRYQLIKKLATGGMAQIYLARQVGPEGFEKMLVVKRILPHLAENREFITMFLDEARIAARLNHPNIVQIFDLGQQDESYFIAMEFIHGEDARRVWKQADQHDKTVPVALICRIIIEACAGLDYAHKKSDQSGRPLNIVHRDVSPQNILVSFEGGVKIVDFGIAKAADQATVTRSGVLKGKYSYMSPEQAAGTGIDHRSDIFALGVVMYELLTGTRLFKRPNDIQTLQAVTDCVVPPPSAANARVPTDLDPIVMKALERDRDDRYGEAKHFAAALEAWLLENRLPSSSAHLAEFLHEIYADRLKKEAEEGRLLIETLDSSREEPAREKGARDPDRTRALRPPPNVATPRPNTVPARPALARPQPRPRETLELPAAPRVASAPQLPPAQPRPATQGQPARLATNYARPAPPRPAVRTILDSGGESTVEATLTTRDDAAPTHRSRLPFVVLGLLALSAAVAGGAWLFGSGPPTVRLLTSPPGATITIDGSRVCGDRVPCVLKTLVPGSHRLLVTADDYEPLVSTLTVPTQGAVDVPIVLTRRAADGGSARTRVTFRLTSQPNGATATINGRVWGLTPLEVTIEAGTLMTVELDLKDFVARTEAFIASTDPRDFTLEPTAKRRPR